MFRVQQVVTRERRATTRLLLLSEVSLGGGGGNEAACPHPEDRSSIPSPTKTPLLNYQPASNSDAAELGETTQRDGD